MKALVTGIGGFTGRYVAQSLVRRGLTVVGLAHSECSVPDVETIHAVDMADSTAITDIVGREKPDYVVHLAAISFILHGNVEEIYRTNIIGTRNLLAATACMGVDVKAVLIASSSNVYGNRTEGIMREDSPVDPLNDYAVSKVAGELVAGLFKSTLPVIVARPFNYTGVGQAKDFLIPKIVDHARSGDKRIRLGNLDVARDFSDVRFVSEAYCRLLECPEAVGATVNVSSGRAYRIAEVLEMMGRITGFDLEVDVDPALVRINDVKQLWGDSSKLDALVGPMERIGLEETLRWMVSHPQ